MPATEQDKEGRFIKGIFWGCIIVLILVVGSCVSLLILGVRSISKLAEQTYEPPPKVEIASNFEHPEVIRLFLGLASPEEAASIPRGSYRLTEGEINAYLSKRLENSFAQETARVKIESGTLLLYFAFTLIKEEKAGDETQQRKRGLSFSPDLKVSYSGKFRTRVEDGRVQLELISLRTGKFPDIPVGGSPQAGQIPKWGWRRPRAPQLARLPHTDGQRLLTTIFEGLSYGSEVLSVELKPLEVLIEVDPNRSASSP